MEVLRRMGECARDHCSQIKKKWAGHVMRGSALAVHDGGDGGKDVE